MVRHRSTPWKWGDRASKEAHRRAAREASTSAPIASVALRARNRRLRRARRRWAGEGEAVPEV